MLSSMFCFTKPSTNSTNWNSCVKMMMEYRMNSWLVNSTLTTAWTGIAAQSDFPRQRILLRERKTVWLLQILVSKCRNLIVLCIVKLVARSTLLLSQSACRRTMAMLPGRIVANQSGEQWPWYSCRLQLPEQWSRHTVITWYHWRNHCNLDNTSLANVLPCLNDTYIMHVGYSVHDVSYYA